MTRTQVAAVVFAMAAFTSAQTPNPKTAPVPVHGQGCAASGVEGGCLVVKDSGSGTLYNLLISGARPRVGEGIEFTGVPFEGVSMCMQGTPVKVTQWSRKESIKCPANETPDKGPGKQ